LKEEKYSQRIKPSTLSGRTSKHTIKTSQRACLANARTDRNKARSANNRYAGKAALLYADISV